MKIQLNICFNDDKSQFNGHRIAAQFNNTGVLVYKKDFGKDLEHRFSSTYIEVINSVIKHIYHENIKKVDICGGFHTSIPLETGLVFSWLKMNNCLTKLALKRAYLTDEDANQIAKNLTMNHTLKWLDLSHNSFSSEGLIALGKALILHQTIAKVFLLQNVCNSEALKFFAHVLKTNAVIRGLYLTTNNRTGNLSSDLTWAEAIGDSLKRCTILDLSINDSEIQDPIALIPTPQMKTLIQGAFQFPGKFNNQAKYFGGLIDSTLDWRSLDLSEEELQFIEDGRKTNVLLSKAQYDEGLHKKSHYLNEIILYDFPWQDIDSKVIEILGQESKVKRLVILDSTL